MIDRICAGYSLRKSILIALVLSALLLQISLARADNNCTDNFGDSGIVSANGSVAIVTSNNIAAGGNLY
jgi:hypothetical protein